MKRIKSATVKLKAHRVFMKKGTCSRTFYYLLNREFGHPNDEQETAVDPLAGGIYQHGYQCGMLWGSSMALGAESHRRCENLGQTTGMAIRSTQKVMESFVGRTKSIECSDVTRCNFKSKLSFIKYMLTGKFISCFILAGKWAPEAIDAATGGLSEGAVDLPAETVSCASELVKKMGGSEREMAIVSGLAGGLGLSGSGCGALAAVIWMKTLARVKEGSWKYTLSSPVMEEIINTFYEATDYEMECRDITGQTFNSIGEHTKFMKNGGCAELIDALAAL